jgi:hypothetical protein
LKEVEKPQVERILGITTSLIFRRVREKTEDPEYAFSGKGRLKAQMKESGSCCGRMSFFDESVISWFPTANILFLQE